MCRFSPSVDVASRKASNYALGLISIQGLQNIFCEILEADNKVASLAQGSIETVATLFEVKDGRQGWKSFSIQICVPQQLRVSQLQTERHLRCEALQHPPKYCRLGVEVGQ